MTTKSFFVAPKDYARPLNVVGEHITVLASGAATGGYEIFLQAGPEGSGPVPHAHPWDESFYVTNGEVDFSIGEMRQSPHCLEHWYIFPRVQATGFGGVLAGVR